MVLNQERHENTKQFIGLAQPLTIEWSRVS